MSVLSVQLLQGLAVVLRVFLGVSLMIHGYPKVKGGWRQAAEWMKSMGVPGATAVLATVVEFFGGLLLVLGFLVPIVAAVVIVQFLSIIVVKKVKMKASYVTLSHDKPSYEIDAFYLFLAVVLLFLGAGFVSLDSILGVSHILGWPLPS